MAGSIGGTFLLWMYVALVYAVRATGGSNWCVFPSYAQNTVNGTADARDWRGMIKEQNRETKFK